ncbi:hypothetical protein HYT17_00445 [Candidatus Microgenomates bacterium]|nr:hypothetical protein [Candidatus Microgenomates bacterium]
MANRSTVTIDSKTAESIFSEITVLEQKLEALKEKVLRFLPTKYGSDLWWKKEIDEAEELFKKGKGIKFNSAKEATAWLNT